MLRYAANYNVTFRVEAYYAMGKEYVHYTTPLYLQ